MLASEERNSPEVLEAHCPCNSILAVRQTWDLVPAFLTGALLLRQKVLLQGSWVSVPAAGFCCGPSSYLDSRHLLNLHWTLLTFLETRWKKKNWSDSGVLYTCIFYVDKQLKLANTFMSLWCYIHETKITPEDFLLLLVCKDGCLKLEARE